MKIIFEKYNPKWINDFENIKNELLELIGFVNPRIEHIGSTSVEGLSAKPIIDILVGVSSEENLEEPIIPLTNNNYIYYERFNREMPYRRFFIKHKINPIIFSLPQIITEKDKIVESTEERSSRLAHIHIMPINSEHWIRHIAFRDYLKTHPHIKNQYQSLKELLSNKEWTDGNEYNTAKNHFIKTEENKAINWYQEKSSL